MSNTKIKVTFYHTAICPRCNIAKLWLSSLMTDYPDIDIQKVDVLANRQKFNEEGLKIFPALVSGNKKISGFYLSKGKIAAFLDCITQGN